MTDMERLRAMIELMDSEAVKAFENVTRICAERDRYRDILLSRHGGECLELIRELDAAREERDALAARCEALEGALRSAPEPSGSEFPGDGGTMPSAPYFEPDDPGYAAWYRDVLTAALAAGEGE